MIYRQPLARYASGQVVKAGVIGTGHFATAVVTQSQSIAPLDVPVICDTNLDAARLAYQRAGLTGDDYRVCDSRQSALDALEHGKRVILEDAALMMDLPLDVIVESTGVPEASALHAQEAIKHGKHVAIVSKEADVTVGPILRYKAAQAGLVYTAVDGDQHGLLIGLVQWAEDLGLEIICAGKSLDGEMVFDAEAGTVSLGDREVYVPPEGRHVFSPGPLEDTNNRVAQRRALLGRFGTIAGYDVVEMAIAANATTLNPALETLHCPIVRIPEIPQVYAPEADGGILKNHGTIDSVRCLRSPNEAGLGGGVFVVVGCANDYSRHILLTKGCLGNRKQTTALIYRPYHLCGVETAISILMAGLLKMPTAPTEYLPRYDVVARATEDLNAGDRVGSDHSKSMQALMRPANVIEDDLPIPLHLANGNKLVGDVPAGEMLITKMIAKPVGSVLWALRAEQDAHFLG